MANKFRGEVDITIGGNQYTLRPTFEALVEFEDRCGMTAYAAMGKMVNGEGFSAKRFAPQSTPGCVPVGLPSATRACRRLARLER
jgi:hypothetical protein